MQTSREEGDNHLYEFGIFRTAPTVSLIRRETLASIASKKFGNARGSMEGGGGDIDMQIDNCRIRDESESNEPPCNNSENRMGGKGIIFRFPSISVRFGLEI